MKRYFKPSNLPFVTLIAGAVGLALRMWLMAAGVDVKGLLVTTHPAHVLVFVLTALALGYIFIAVRPLNPVGQYSDLFPKNPLASAGCIAAAIGVLLACLQERGKRADMVTNVSLILGVLAAVCLVLIAICRFQGRRPFFGLHCIVTLFMMVHLISQYRLFSSEPQLQVYFFPLLGSVSLMLTAYYSAVLDARKSSRRWFVFCNQSALFFCCVSICSEIGLFYLTMAFWMFTGLCSLDMTAPEIAEEAD